MILFISHNAAVISSPLIAYLHTAEVTAGYNRIVKSHLFTLKMSYKLGCVKHVEYQKLSEFLKLKSRKGLEVQTD